MHEVKTPKSKLMSAPLRVYWSLRPEDSGGVSSDAAVGFARELAELRVFFVTLGLSGGLREDISGIVGELKKGGVRVIVSADSEESLPDCGMLAAVDAIDIRAGGTDTCVVIKAALGCDKPLSLSVVPERGTADSMADAVRMAVEAGILTINLVNPDIIDDPNVGRFVLDAGERAAIKAALESVLSGYGGSVKVMVHDLFLHRELCLPGLGDRIEYAGCQAADAIAYIDSSGTIYPCASMQELLGHISTGLKVAWKSDARRSVRERILSDPAGCAGCAELSSCMGGCRGLAFATGGQDAKDPNCGK